MLYSLFKFALFVICKVLFRLKVKGLENLPRSGAVVIAANHSSFLDPVTLAVAVPRQVVFLVMKPVYNFWPLAWFFRIMPCIPLNGALNRAVDALKKGAVVGVFPEGGRSEDGRLKNAKLGAARLAMLSGAPILPVGICGAYEAYPPHRLLPRPRQIEVRIGSPIVLPQVSGEIDMAQEKEAYSHTKLIMEKIEELMGRRVL